MPDSEQQLLFGNAYTPASASTVPDGPYSAAIRNAGGIACSWGNGLGLTDHIDPIRDLLQISLLPGTSAERWDEYASVYPQNTPEEGFGDGSGSRCDADETRRDCYSDILVGDVWVQMHVVGVNVPDGETGDAGITAFVRPIIERLVERVAAATASAAPSPVEIVPSTDCDTVLPLDAVRELLGITEDGVARDVRDGEQGGGLSLPQDARMRAGLTSCIVAPRSDSVWAQATVLPDGAWAFEPTAVTDGVRNGAELIVIDGAETSYMECPPGGTQCTVDMAVGGSWVRVELPVDSGTVVGAGERSEALALAALVAAKVD